MGALRTLFLKSKLDLLKQERENLNPDFEKLEEREKEITEAIEEITEETTQEEREVVEQNIEELEEEKAKLEEEKKNLDEKIKEIEEEIQELEEDVEEETTEEVVDEVEEARSKKEELKTREVSNMNSETRAKIQQLIEREDVKKFLDQTRNLMQGRGVDGGKVTIPTTIVDVVRTEIDKYSKLISYVDKVSVKGIARETIIGEYPEAVWIETCTNLNELQINIYDVEVDGYTVGGFIPVCRSAIMDSNLDLANEVIKAIGQAIGKAVDKAIVYGTGKKMPVGIVTRLAQTEKPENYRVTNQAWENLSETNIKQVTGTSAKLFQNILGAVKLRKDSKGGEKIWIMNEVTKTKLITESLSFNAAGALVSGMNNTFPVSGGEIVELDFIPDGDVIVGYGKQYLLAEREGIVLENSDDVYFFNHKRVYKGLARYDGTPVNGKGFALLNIDGKAPTKTLEFAEDKANKESKATSEEQ